MVPALIYKISLIIPISIDDEIYKSTNAIAPNLRKRNIGDFRDWQSSEGFETAFTNLLEALNVDREMEGPTSYL